MFSHFIKKKASSCTEGQKSLMLICNHVSHHNHNNKMGTIIILIELETTVHKHN